MTPATDRGGARTMTEPDITGGFVRLLGMEFVEVGPERVVLRWTVRPELHQPFGILHGGVHCAAIETAASIAGAAWFGDRGDVVGVSNQTDFLRAVRDGALAATATPIHRGRLQQLWQVEIRDDDDRLVARGQVRLQNIDHTDRLSSTTE
jgi:1,4-dihydroxy-2-naphthoyl-CoA hydrolase